MAEKFPLRAGADRAPMKRPPCELIDVRREKGMSGYPQENVQQTAQSQALSSHEIPASGLEASNDRMEIDKGERKDGHHGPYVTKEVFGQDELTSAMAELVHRNTEKSTYYKLENMYSTTRGQEWSNQTGYV